MDHYEHQETKKGLAQVILTFGSASFYYSEELLFDLGFLARGGIEHKTAGHYNAEFEKDNGAVTILPG